MLKVLIVDDQYGILLLLQEVIGKLNIKIDTASNGKEAIEKFKKGNHGLVILDLKMPVMDGLEVLRKLKELSPVVDVFSMSAYSENEIVDKALKLGITRHFPKPFNIDEIAVEVSKWKTEKELEIEKTRHF